MHYPHRIRLRGPWECEPLLQLARGADGRAELLPDAVPAKLRMTMPCHWREGGLADFAGRVRFERHFGYPGQIDAHERVWLTFAGVEGAAEVWLNSRFLGRHDAGCGPFEHEVTSLLGVRNKLTVEVEELTGAGGLWGEVALEIRCTAFLRAVRAWLSRSGESVTLHVTGEVVGTSSRPLDLYVLLDGSNLAYTTIQAAPAGQPFAIRAEGPASARSVRVELVDAATVWYTVEQPLDATTG